MSKKGENIRKRKDSRYEARYIKGKTDDGKAIWGYVYGKTYKEVKQKKEIKLLDLRLASESKVVSIKMNSIIDDFLLQEIFQVKESTFAHYKNIIDTHIRPQLGNLNGCEIKSTDIESFTYNKLNNGRLDGYGGLSSKSVKDILTLLKKILKYGVEKNAINDEALHFSLPKTRKNKIQILSKEDLQLIVYKTQTSEDICDFGIYLCLHTGLRIGEICALKWNDFNFNNKTLYINKTMSRIYNTATESNHKTKIIIDTPKTQTSDRIIPLPDFLIEPLIQRKQCAVTDDSYFLTGSQKFIEPRTYYAKYKRFLNNNGLHSYSFHALRHTFATRCIEIGFDPKTLSEILGHSDVKVTLDRYVHPSMDLKRDYMNMYSCV